MQKNHRRTMKRALVSFLSVIMVLCTAPISGFAGIDLTVTASAEAIIIKSGDCGAQGDNVKYSLYDDGTLVISGTGDMVDYEYIDVLINDTEYPAPNAPYGDYSTLTMLAVTDSNIKKVIIEDGVTRIGAYAFAALSNLTDIIIPETVKSIGYGAFAYCFRLSEIEIPDSVTDLDEYTFFNCMNLNLVELSNSLTGINQCTFGFCVSLKEIVIPDSVTSIGNSAFSDCWDLKNVTFPDSLVTIERFAFERCINLKEISLPESVQSLGKEAFYCCNSLNTIKLFSDNAALGKKSVGYLQVELTDEEFLRFNEILDQECDVISEPSSSIDDLEQILELVDEIYPDFDTRIGHIFDEEDTDITSSALTIYGHTGSAAEIYANENNLRFAELPESEHTHEYTSSVTTPATCTQTGVLTYTCTCGDSYTEVIPVVEHSFGDFTQTKAPTVFAEGEAERSCEICGYKETKAVAKLESETATDEQTGVTMIYEPDAFDSEVTISVAVTENSGVFELDDKLCDKFISYDIKALCGGEKVQPSKTVWVTVPLSDGFNEAYTVVYYVDENGVKEIMNSFCSDGTITFEASHFSEYVLVDESSYTEPTEPDEPGTDTCSHICHKGGFAGFVWKILNFFNKLFKINPVCECGMRHY